MICLLRPNRSRSSSRLNRLPNRDKKAQRKRWTQPKSLRLNWVKWTSSHTFRLDQGSIVRLTQLLVVLITSISLKIRIHVWTIALKTNLKIFSPVWISSPDSKYKINYILVLPHMSGSLRLHNFHLFTLFAPFSRLPRS